MGFARAWDSVTGMLAAPVVGNVDTRHVFLLVGLVLGSAFIWFFVVAQLKGLAEEIV